MQASSTARSLGAVDDALMVLGSIIAERVYGGLIIIYHRTNDCLLTINSNIHK